MNKSIKNNLRVIILTLLMIGMLCSCGSSTPSAIPQPEKPPGTPESNNSPKTATKPNNEQKEPINMVEVVYFHPKRRCGPCISVEVRTPDLLEREFKDAMDSGKITFQSYELGDPENASIIKKYGAVSSQLFINTIKNGNENIKHVEEVWIPNILNDATAFDEFLGKLFSQSLAEVT